MHTIGVHNWCTQLCAQLGAHIIDYYFYLSVPFSFFGDANFSLLRVDRDQKVKNGAEQRSAAVHPNAPALVQPWRTRHRA